MTTSISPGRDNYPENFVPGKIGVLILGLMIAFTSVATMAVVLIPVIEADTLNDFEGGVSENLPTDGEYNAIAIGDINGDFKPDMAFGGEDYSGADTEGLYVYTGNGNGIWTAAYSGLPTEDSWGGIAFGDADGDGKIELYAGNEGWGSHSGSIQGVGVWEYSGGSWSTSGISSPHSTKTVNDVEILNFTKGPGLDIALSTSRSGDGGIRVYSGSGSSPISWTANSNGLPTSGQYNGIDVGDLNNDGLGDIATVSYSNSGLHIFTQNAGGNGWTDCTASLPSGAKSGNMDGVIIGDLNNDGNADIVYSLSGNKGMRIVLGNGGGSSGGTTFSWTEPVDAFPNSGTSGRFFQLQLADIDKDDDLDLLGPKSSSGLHLYLGNGNENPDEDLEFTEVTGKGLPSGDSYYGSVFFDMDNDDDLDIAGATWGDGVSVFRTSLSSSDELPVAHAGDDIQVLTGDSVTLDGSGSYDPEDGENIGYEWEEDGGNPEGVSLSDPHAEKPDFTAPNTPGNYTFTLSVNDSREQWSDPDSVVVRVLNRPPMAHAGDDQEILTGDTVTLDGSGSIDPEDGHNLIYHWNSSDGNPANVTLSDEYAEKPEFTAPDIPGNYNFTLKVRDTYGSWSDPDIVAVKIMNRPPIADAGVDISRTVDSEVVLNGSKSSDPDGSLEHFNWTCTSHTVTLESLDSAFPSFVPDLEEIYMFTLRVQDDQGTWSLIDDSINVTVVAKGVNLIPSADAGSDKIEIVGSQVILDGTASTDADGFIVTWEWICISHGGTVIQDPNSSRPSFVPDVAELYTFSLRVRDDNGSWSTVDYVNITVRTPPSVPVADAGDDFTAVVGTTVFLDGSESYDSDGFIVNYTWVCTSHIVNLAYPGSQSNPSFVPNAEGMYKFTLWVKDNDGLMSSMEMINVTAELPTVNRAPEVNLTYPTGGEVLSGEVAIQWEVFDPDGDNITYMIELSIDSGTTFTKVLEGPGLSSDEGEFTWIVDDGRYPNGNQYRLRITVTDENEVPKSTVVESGELTIFNEPDDDDGDDDVGEDEGGLIPGFGVGMCVSVFIITFTFTVMKRRNVRNDKSLH